jgi:hypothetical protein
MLGFLDELEAADNTAKSLYLPFGLSHLEVDDLLREMFDTQDISTDVAEIAISSTTGRLFFGLFTKMSGFTTISNYGKTFCSWILRWAAAFSAQA